MEDITRNLPPALIISYALGFLKSFDEQHMLAHMLAPSFSAPLITW